jgi:hypothetical protein
MKTDLPALKERFTVPDAWRALGLPGEPRMGVQRSPFRDDSKPSFSIYNAGRRFKDFALVEHCGDVFDFCALALQADNAAAIRWVKEKLGIVSASEPRTFQRWPREVAELALHSGTASEFAALSAVRGISEAGLRLAAERGFLRFGEALGFVCWCVVDSRGQLAELRRLDGLPFPAVGALAERKAHCIGRGKAWPVGIMEAQAFKKVCIVEGSPDLLACHDIALVEGKAEGVACVAMLGGANRMAPEAVAMLAGREVWLYPHADEAGQRTGEEWANGLAMAGVGEVFTFDLGGMVRRDGKPGKDLNDYIHIAHECWQHGGEGKWREVLP